MSTWSSTAGLLMLSFVVLLVPSLLVTVNEIPFEPGDSKVTLIDTVSWVISIVVLDCRKLKPVKKHTVKERHFYPSVSTDHITSHTLHTITHQNSNRQLRRCSILLLSQQRSRSETIKHCHTASENHEWQR